jgi:hypothetical protein
MTIVLKPDDRRVMLLALASLALLRPDWDGALGRIAATLKGRTTFPALKKRQGGCIDMWELPAARKLTRHAGQVLELAIRAYARDNTR